MSDITATFSQYLPLPFRHLNWRAHPLDGKLLLFQRDYGLNVLLDGEETRHLRRIAPRTLLIAVTNACNLSCQFCYRDQESRSLWRSESLVAFCQQVSNWGVLEVAFGGGEPTMFPHWAEFIHTAYETTNLCINFTTNGTLLTEQFLLSIAGKYGQIRLSLYDDNHYEKTIALLVQCQARFGVNWLITPDELKMFEQKFIHLLALGVRDFLLLSYKGDDVRMHLAPDDCRHLAKLTKSIHEKLGSSVQLKLDVCWGSSLADVPRLFVSSDCGAGDDFLSITSDKHVKVCSFQQTSTGIPFETVDDLRRIWQQQRLARTAALIGGCARLPNRGLTEGSTSNAYIDLAAVQ